MNDKDKPRICLGAFAGAHGVRGEAKVKCFTEELNNIAAYGPVETEDRKRQFTLSVIRSLKADFVLVRAPQIQSREDAEALKGVRFYVARDQLPAPDEDEFYLNDLVGLDVVDEAGAPLGAVNAVYNFGAGDVIELMGVPGIKGMRLVRFTKQNVPEVDIAGGKITVRRAAVMVEDEPGPELGEDDG
jgi:16S rRNA processing protein RimM